MHSLKAYEKTIGMNLSKERRAAFNKFNEYVYHKKIILDKVKVCFCGCKKFEDLSKFDRFGLPFGTKICLECGLINQTVRINPKSMELFYEEIYWPLVLGSTKKTNFLTKGKKDESQSYILSFIDQTKSDIIIFEVGCGSGERISKLSKELKQKGKSVTSYGADYSDDVLLEAKGKGINTIKGGFEELSKYGKADILILSHLFEHLPDLHAALRDISLLIHDDSLIYIEVPGVKDLYQKKEYLYSYQLYNVLAHTYNFTLTTLTNVMGVGGFTCVAGDEFVRSVFKRGSINKLQKNDYVDTMKFLKLAEKNNKKILKQREKFGKNYFKNILKQILKLDV